MNTRREPHPSPGGPESALQDLRRVTRLDFSFKPCDPSWRVRLARETLQHTCAYCEAVKTSPRRLARCIGADDSLAEQPPELPLCRVCPFGVREWIVPLRSQGKPLGVLFVGASRAPRRPALHEPHLRSAYDRLPRFDPENAAAMGRLLQNILLHHLDHATEQVWRQRAGGDPAIARALDYIQAAGRVNLRVPELARHVHLSPSRFLHRFHDALGIGFGECVRTFALEKAQSLVTGSDLRIVDIASELGYSSQNHFAQQFKAFHGHSATEARRLARGHTESHDQPAMS